MTRPVMQPEETLNSMLDKAQRRLGTPVRRTFVQGGSRRNPQPGPLAEFVAHRDETCLDLGLLTLTLATKEPYRVIYAAGWWARALRLSSPTLISKAWKRLEDRRLISRRREGRVLVVTPRKEDGKGSAYERPIKGEAYGILPLAYWRDELFLKLDLPAKAMLLIALTQHGAFTLPTGRAKGWYGISADTAERGLRTLRQEQLLTRKREWRVSRYAPNGYAETFEYSLTGALGRRKEVELKVVK